MNKNVKSYLECLNESLKTSDSKIQVYKKVGSKLVLICNSNTRTEINKMISDSLDSMVSENIKLIVIVAYNVTMTNFLYGPLQMVVEIIPINDNGKLDKKTAKSQIIYYTEDEIENRGLKKTDYKVVVQKLLKGELEGGLKTKVSASQLDD